MRIGIRQVHQFLTQEMPRRVVIRYRNLKILNESDFSREATNRIAKFLRQDSNPKRLSVSNCLYCKPSKTYPDIVILKRNKPWVIIELKEKRKLDAATLASEKSKMLHQHEALRTKRGYFIYLARYGKHRLLRRKLEYGYWFYEVPITLERNASMSPSEVASWEKTFKKLNRYKGDQ